MRRDVPIRNLLFCALLGALLFVALPQVAQASCQGRCVNVAPPGEFCRRCVDTGAYTGQACHDSGKCGCVYVLCTSALSQLSGSPLLADPPVPADLLPMSSVDSGTCAATVPLVAQVPPQVPAAEPAAD